MVLPWSRDALLRHPAATAVVWVAGAPPCVQSVSYAELTAMADRVSRLVLRSASRETGVGLCLDNSLATVACQLGTLWAGNHFVPLDQPSAQPRLSEMLDQSGIEVCFCSPQLAAEVSKVLDACHRNIAILVIDDAELTCPTSARYCMMGEIAAEVAPSMAVPSPCRRVCTFHTSGTTGAPKPIHSTPEQWAAFVTAAARPYHLTASSRILVVTSAIFDPSAGLTFAALAIGAAICLAPWPFTLQYLRLTVELTRATHACSTPSVWALFDLEDDAEVSPGREDRCTLTTLILGGEPMHAAMIRVWLSRGVTLINTYGTTEATVYQWAYELPRHAAALSDAQLEQHARCLGVPFDGIDFALMQTAPGHGMLDDFPGVQSVGDAAAHNREEVGELVLTGLQVGGAGRWTTPTHTTAGIDTESDAGSNVGGDVGDDAGNDAGGDVAGLERFHTGDLVRCHGGSLFYLGRADQQIKLNGRRIELGPIGAAICDAMHPLVRRALVQLVDGRLHAFCVTRAPPPEDRASPGYAITATAIRVLSALELAPYLVPPSVTLLHELPTTPTGKTDARALGELARAPLAPVGGTAVVDEDWTPRDDHGVAPWCPEGWLGLVATCWSLELHIPISDLRCSSNFCELSGDSLVALKICARLWRRRQRRCAEGAEGGLFGERMGTFAPVNLMATPVLSEYAALLEAEAEAADFAVVEAPEGHTAPCDEQGEGATAVGYRAPTDAVPLSELDTLATSATVAGEVSLLQMLLRRHYAPRVPLGMANCLLLAAVGASQCECAALMLRCGASPNATRPGSDITALQSAVQLKDGGAVVDHLLSACASVMAVDANCQTALHHAARAGAGNDCLTALLEHSEGASEGAVRTACGLLDVLDVWGRTALHWAVINGNREAVVTLVEAGSDISLRDLQNDSSLDLAERRAECMAMAATGKCDRLTVHLLKLMLPSDHVDYRSFHPDGLMDSCTWEVVAHAKRLGMTPAEREALLSMSPEERAAIGDHVMTMDELDAKESVSQMRPVKDGQRRAQVNSLCTGADLIDDEPEPAAVAGGGGSAGGGGGGKGAADELSDLEMSDDVPSDDSDGLLL